jgi:hypothetical protein
VTGVLEGVFVSFCSGTTLGGEEGNKEEDSMQGLTVRTPKLFVSNT